MNISDISPSLSYDDAPAAIEWLCEAFGFTKRLIVPGEAGIIRHSELSLGNAAIMVSSARPAEGRLSPRSLTGLNQALAVRVDDPDAHFLLAKAAGAEIVAEPQNEEFGARGYMAKDLEGHQWYFGTYLPGTFWDKEASPEV